MVDLMMLYFEIWGIWIKKKIILKFYMYKENIVVM